MATQRAILDRGDRISRYTITRMLGKGGFGVTYLAGTGDAASDSSGEVTLTILGRDQHPPRRSEGDVAIKEFFPTDLCHRTGTSIKPHSDGEVEAFEEGKRRFLEEARIVKALDHPNIVKCLEIIETNNTVYMVMPYYHGETLTEQLREREKLKPEEVQSIYQEIGSALDYIHRLSIYHRDIKPSNLYYSREHGRYVLLDFGAARQRIADVSRSFTAVLTEGYAPFEQYTRNSQQDRRTDYYALAATLYHAITGKRPMPATDRIANDRLTPLAELRPEGYDVNFLKALDALLAVQIEKRPNAIDTTLSVQPSGASRFTQLISPRKTRLIPDRARVENPVEVAGAVAPPSINYLILLFGSFLTSGLFFLPAVFWDNYKAFLDSPTLRSLTLYAPGHLALAVGLTFMTLHVTGKRFNIAWLVVLLIANLLIETFATTQAFDKPVVGFQWVIWAAALGLTTSLYRRLATGVLFTLVSMALWSGVSLLHYGYLVNSATSTQVAYLIYSAIAYGLILFFMYAWAGWSRQRRQT